MLLETSLKVCILCSFSVPIMLAYAPRQENFILLGYFTTKVTVSIREYWSTVCAMHSSALLQLAFNIDCSIREYQANSKLALILDYYHNAGITF